MNRLYYSYTLFALMVVLTACGPGIPDEYFNSGPSPYGEYSKAGVEYFKEIGFCFEFGNCNKPAVKKWTSTVMIRIHGNYTESDEIELDHIIEELSELTGLSIIKVTKNANINIHFVAQNKFKKYIPLYNTNNPQDGIFHVSLDNGVIHKATICIEDHFSEQKKHHLLREELTQSFGLAQDSYQYPNSIFQQDPQYKPTEYSHIDKEVIRMLYNDKVKPGMSQVEVVNVLTVQPTNQQQVASVTSTNQQQVEVTSSNITKTKWLVVTQPTTSD